VFCPRVESFLAFHAKQKDNAKRRVADEEGVDFGRAFAFLAIKALDEGVEERCDTLCAAERAMEIGPRAPPEPVAGKLAVGAKDGKDTKIFAGDGIDALVGKGFSVMEALAESVSSLFGHVAAR